MGWFTKTVEVEKIVERPVPGEACRVSLYRAYSEYPDYSFGVISCRRDEFGFYLSCADAFKAHPGCKVQEKTGIRIGSEYFAIDELKPVTVTKPKRAKGKP